MNPPTHIVARSDDTQLRLQWLPGLGEAGAIDARLFRRSPNVDDVDAAYVATQAGFCIPRGQAKEFLRVLAELIAELDA